MDKKARKILYKRYWSSNGWLPDKSHFTSKEDFEYAKSKGVMFDSVSVSKQQLISRLEEILIQLPQKKVTDAFLCSLTNKKLEWRSGLASYANARKLLTEKKVDDYFYGYGDNIDLNILNFERLKWGGVRYSRGIYNLLDLELLSKELIQVPSQEDLDLFRRILELIESMAVNSSPSNLRNRLKEVVPFSKNERHGLMEILGCSGILKPLSYDRKEPGRHDWTFVQYWRGGDGYDKNEFLKYFKTYFPNIRGI